jgi:hypothetical protein
MRVRNRDVIVLLLPVAMMLWMVGWVPFWEGLQSKPQRRKTAAKDDGIEIAVVVFEKNADSNSQRGK